MVSGEEVDSKMESEDSSVFDGMVVVTSCDALVAGKAAGEVMSSGYVDVGVGMT